MIYDPDDFVKVCNQVEAEGGTFPPEACEGKRIRYRIPRARGKHEWRERWTSHCGMHAKLGIPYDPTMHVRLRDEDDDTLFIVDHEGEKGDPGVAIVCANDDCVGLWPRYAGVVSEATHQPLGAAEKEFE